MNIANKVYRLLEGTKQLAVGWDRAIVIYDCHPKIVRAATGDVLGVIPVLPRSKLVNAARAAVTAALREGSI